MASGKVEATKRYFHASGPRLYAFTKDIAPSARTQILREDGNFDFPLSGYVTVFAGFGISQSSGSSISVKMLSSFTLNDPSSNTILSVRSISTSTTYSDAIGNLACHFIRSDLVDDQR